MNDELKQSVHDYLESKQLTHAQLAELENRMQASASKSSSTSLLKFNIVAVVLVIALVSSLFWGLSIDNRAGVAELIAEEVAYNHLKLKPMEVSSSSLNDMRSYFSELDFSLSQSKYIVDKGLKLVGGRYCSIQGEAAAQLRMQDENTGDMQIVYQAPYNKELFQDLPKLHEGQAPVRHFVNGIAVDVWVEKGILFARSYNH